MIPHLSSFPLKEAKTWVVSLITQRTLYKYKHWEILDDQIIKISIEQHLFYDIIMQ